VKGISVNLLWDHLASKFDQCLRQSGIVTLQPWQREIRDYVGTAKESTLFAKNNLVDWGRRSGSCNRHALYADSAMKAMATERWSRLHLPRLPCLSKEHS
jgi:hypothetical protein